MGKNTTTIVLALVLCLTTLGSGCILQDVVANIILTNEACAPYHQSETSASWNTPYVLQNYGDQLDQALADAGYTRDDIVSASLMAGHYGVTAFDGQHDWLMGGRITVQRLDGQGGPVADLIDYTSVSVQQALGQKYPAPLNAAGVAVIDTALADFLRGANPTLQFEVVNDSVTPQPTVQDSMVFDWMACITVQVVIETTVENIPDPWDTSN